MREPSVPPLLPALALCLAPAAIISAAMLAVVSAAEALHGQPGALRNLHDGALLLNLGVWFGFAPAYLYGWVQTWDPRARARTGVVGLVALTCVAWLVNLGAYGVAGSLLAALLRG